MIPAPLNIPSLNVDAFPAEFLWGAATSAYQIEGAAAEGGRGPSIWDTFAHTPGKIAAGDTGDIACDHFHRWPGDLELIRHLGLRAYRMSLSWSRLQPGGRGPLNAVAVSHYQRLLAGLRDIGVRPFVTLYHWDLPQPLEDAGGWPARDAAYRFADYVAEVMRRLGDQADDWITVNEPWCSAFLGYGDGAHAPGRQDLRAAVAAAHHQNLAHGLAVLAVRAERTAASVGGSNLITDVVAASAKAEDIAAARRVDANNNRMFLDPMLRGTYPDELYELYGNFGLPELVRDGDESLIATPGDFAGINHYQQILVRADPGDRHLGAHVTPAGPPSTSLGWSVNPQSLRSVLTRISREYTDLPLYVTENGVCSEDLLDGRGQVVDTDRVAYLHGYLTAAGEAISRGVNLQGYFAWSLLDNFEWAEGYRRRFGLIYVDYPTQARIPKASAAWYREVIARHVRRAEQDDGEEGSVAAI